MDRRIDLNGPWRLWYFDERELDVSTPDGLTAVPRQPIPSEVPGTVELDLMRAGILPDLFVGTNIRGLRKYESCQWWYRRSFPTPKDVGRNQVFLRFHGIDCIATVWLNGAEIARTDNMLIEHLVEVTGKLAKAGGENDLAVQIRSPVNGERSRYYPPASFAGVTNYEHLYVRKAPHMYGWDITPRAVSAGLWRGVELEIREPVRIRDLYFATTEVDRAGATLLAHWQFETDDLLTDGYALRFSGVCGESRFDQVVQAHYVAGSVSISIPGARLWWPRGYGEPNLYSITTELLKDGKVADRREDRIGVRRVELRRTDVTRSDAPGEFLFLCNGQPVLCKGSNWVPLDAFHARDAGRYDRVLALVDELGCNILRCWGGNVYEDHAFFDHCDSHGILVWQDFSFACALYPNDQAFLDRVRDEAQAVVRTLRNHPSIALWSGDNEIDIISLFQGIDPSHNKLNRQVIPAVCHEEDPYRAYIPSSPYVSPQAALARDVDQRIMPEQHLWGPRDYFKSKYYAETTAHFASEIGYHGCPNVSSIRRFIEPSHLWPWKDNEQWRVHAADQVTEGGPYAYRIKLMADQIHELFGFEPETLEDFALASQISQAEAKKFFIEMFRIRKWRRTGIIWWNVMDCWPQFSDAIVDYYFAKKLAFWYIKRVQVPALIMVDEPEAWNCRVVAGNDSLQPVRGTFTITDADGGGQVCGGPFDVGPNENRQIGSIRISHGDHRLFLIRWTIEGKEYGNHYLLGKPPFSYPQYKAWLGAIAQLPIGFREAEIAK